MLSIVAATVTENTILPPLCHPSDLLIYQPQAKQRIERTNHTAKFLSPKLKSDVLRKSEAKINNPRSKGTLYDEINFFISVS
ncbi:MAG: hypothetical protein M5T52_14190 [Ignavibacteriaceae bacterium]|nr:hypothetical protein [Ignavibacteriaceae bacterium]